MSSCLLAALAMLAKETGLTALLAGLAYDLYRSWPHVRRALAEGRWNEEGLQFARRAAKALVAVSWGVSVNSRLSSTGRQEVAHQVKGMSRCDRRRDGIQQQLEWTKVRNWQKRERIEEERNR